MSFWERPQSTHGGLCGLPLVVTRLLPRICALIWRASVRGRILDLGTVRIQPVMRSLFKCRALGRAQDVLEGAKAESAARCGLQRYGIVPRSR